MDTYVAPTPAIRTSRILVGVMVAALAFGALTLGVALATRAISFDFLTTATSQDAVDPGYLPHYGLAGPSGVASGSSQVGGVPAHGGLAGPSGASPAGGVPAHGGLAGPSGVGLSH